LEKIGQDYKVNYSEVIGKFEPKKKPVHGQLYCLKLQGKTVFIQNLTRTDAENEQLADLQRKPILHKIRCF
jgi:hypothetical protein